jgi:hypothetical protein
MAATVRFWETGFHGLIAYGALGTVDGMFYAKAFLFYTQRLAVVPVTFFVMAILCLSIHVEEVRIAAGRLCQHRRRRDVPSGIPIVREHVQEAPGARGW